MAITQEKHLYNNIDVLIVEDELDICFLLSGVFKKKNLHSTYANSIHEGSSILALEHPSILVLDNNLPDGRGIDFIYKLKSGHPAMKIIMITADDTPSNKSQALKAGADFFIGKPFTMDTINNTIDKVMATVRQHGLLNL